MRSKKVVHGESHARETNGFGGPWEKTRQDAISRTPKNHPPIKMGCTNIPNGVCPIKGLEMSMV